MTDLEKLSNGQLVRMVKAYRLALLAHEQGSRMASAGFVATADRIASEPVEASDWEAVTEWALGSSDRECNLHFGGQRKQWLDPKNWVELLSNDVRKSFHSRDPLVCLTKAAAWVRAQLPAEVDLPPGTTLVTGFSDEMLQGAGK
jgi:hypothetical protein